MATGKTVQVQKVNKTNIIIIIYCSTTELQYNIMQEKKQSKIYVNNDDYFTFIYIQYNFIIHTALIHPENVSNLVRFRSTIKLSIISVYKIFINKRRGQVVNR